jgi:hypothetical protein
MQNAGEVWELKYRRRKQLILGVALLVSGLACVVIKIAGDESVIFPSAPFGPAWHVSLAVRILVAVLFFGALGLVARWNWLASDEVRRSHMLSFWAAIGFSVGITFFGFMLFGREIPEEARLPLAFFLPLGLGTLFALVRWIRDGFVW